MATLASRDDILELDEAGLRARIFSLVKENEALEARLAEFEGAQKDSRGQKCPSCGFLGTFVTAEQNATETKEIPMLPNEIISMISEYFNPGSRTLANLSQSCRGLYELLLPRLYHEFSLQDVCRVVNRITTHTGRSKSLPFCVDAIAKLDTRLGDAEISVVRRLLFNCDNVVELGCDWLDFCQLFSWGPIDPRENLEVLTIHLDSNFPSFLTCPMNDDLFPKLRTLNLEGTANARAMRFFDDQCPSIEEVNVEFWEVEEGWDPASIPATFIGKIRSWTYGELDDVCQTVNESEMSALEDISISDRCWAFYPPLPDQWQSFCGLSSLRFLELGVLNSFLLLLGLPPNLETLTVANFRLTLDFASEIPFLDAFIASIKSRPVRFSLTFLPRDADMEAMDEARFRCLDAELQLWQSVEGFEIWGGLEDYERRKRELGI